MKAVAGTPSPNAAFLAQMLTYCLLKGLAGVATDKNGRVTVQGLYDYLVPKVRDAAGRENREQMPQRLSPTVSEAAAVSLR